jgi:DNA-binding FadR family transcriptional regulator
LRKACRPEQSYASRKGSVEAGRCRVRICEGVGGGGRNEVARQHAPPKDYAKWAELVYQWTRHNVERYGRDEVESWYFKGRAADQSFHFLILECTRNEPLVTLSTSIAAAVEWTTMYARNERRDLRDPMPDHHAVFDAIMRGDSEAARTRMAELIKNAFGDTGFQEG